MNKTLATLTAVALGATVTAVGPTAYAKAKPQTSINVVLKSSHDGALTNYVYDTVTPTAANYHHYLTPTAFADQFGQSAATVNQFKTYFAKYHLKTKVFSGRLVLRVTGERKNLVKAFAAKLTKTKTSERTTTKLPAKLSKKTVAVVGLYATKADAKKTATHSYTKMEKKPDTSLSGSDFAKKYGGAKFANQYSLDQLTKQGLTGQGQRIGIITLSSDMNPSDAQVYWKKVGVPSGTDRITKIYTDDTESAVNKFVKVFGFNAGQVESTLDVEQAGEVAPGVKIDMYSAVSANDTEHPDQLYFNAFAHAISGNRDQQLSTSFSSGIEDAKSFSRGASETVGQYNAAFNLIYRGCRSRHFNLQRQRGHGSVDAADGD